MEPERWARIDALLQDALDAESTAARRALFEAEPDGEIRREAEALLAALGEGEAGARRLDGVVGAALAWAEEVGEPEAAVPGDAPPERLGPYRVVREIGRGGLATVYLAERDDAEFNQQVAVKLIRRGLESREILARLRLERQILARLDHPHIARLFDGGTTADGRPFFVMEAIDGEPIDVFCAQRALPLAARVELLRKVCAAVDYAHRNLVLHRDIKPSNVLVAHDGTPKLLDFGIAKLLDPESADGSSGLDLELPTLTRAGDRFLTPEFASPEQLRGEPLSTASDVYALGVLAYLLVAGRHPYRFESRRLAEIERVVCEDDPAPPSAGRVEDLDRIVLMALAKEPARRYATAGQLAEDLARWSADLPVVARADTLAYRARKFVRRHRLPVAAGTLVLGTLVAAVIVTSWQAKVARAERVRAETERARAAEVAGFLTGLFQSSDPTLAAGRTVSVREILDEGARRIHGELGSSPQLQAELMATMGRAYQSLAVFPEAGRLLEEAVAIRRRPPVDAAALAASLRDLGFLRHEEQSYGAARALLTEALELQTAMPEPVAREQALTLHFLAKVEAERGDYGRAEELYERCFELYRTRADDPEGLLDALDSFGQMWMDRQDARRAEKIFRPVYEESRKRWGEEHPRVVNALNNLAVALAGGGERAQAAALYVRLLELNRQIYGPRHRQVALTLYNLATSLDAAHEGERVLALLAEALAIDLEVHGENHPVVARDLHTQATTYEQLGQLEEASRLAVRALAIDRAAFGEQSPQALRHLNLVARLARERGDPAAEPLLRDLVAIMRRVMPAGDNRLSFPLHTLGRLRLERGDAAGALAVLEEAWAIRRAVLGDGHPALVELARDLERCRTALASRPRR